MKIRKLKVRHTAPYSIIAPSKDWIRDNCIVTDKGEEWLDKLPGPYTLIFKLRNPDAVCPDVLKGIDTLGVRIPDHWFSDVVKDLTVPIITTSVNKSSNPFMTSMDDLDTDIKSEVDFIVDEGKIEGKPSTIFARRIPACLSNLFPEGLKKRQFLKVQRFIKYPLCCIKNIFWIEDKISM